ncbi:cuticlin-4 [Aethina tumida]|uniref:cuticlin-4 n=1 Tax=Aethina tumida TaxID=116153 RepID=UPI00096AE5AF|nr:cuticlin-4 [Aethina tumida]
MQSTMKQYRPIYANAANIPLPILLVSIFLISFQNTANAANIPPPTTIAPEVASDVRVECNSDEILVHISTRSGRFNGMIYPRGLSKNSSCMGEWVQRPAPVQYTLPLRGCNTMSTELDDGGIEYFNTIVVQPHLKLVTNQGRGFHIRCRYNTRNNTITNDSLKVDLMSADPITALAPMPGCSMKIFSGDPTEREVAENVKIGDPLTLVVSLDDQETYGIRVTDCLVRDGLGWGEQKLISDDGCPLDSEIMGMFEYSQDKTRAAVKFQAHKFPYTASVYYQCNVKLCLKADNGCEYQAPSCGGNRIRRQAASESSEGTPATIEVYSGLYVNEANDLAKAGQEDGSVFSEKATEDSICISQRSFAIGICIAGLILMLCVVFAILCLMARRRKKTTSNPGSSIYSGPYTNTAYSHSS